MLSFLLWPLFVLLPGASTVLLVRPSMLRRPVLLVAVAPALTFAVSMVTATLLDRVRVGPWPGVLVISTVLAIGAAVRLLLRRRHGAKRGGHVPDTEATPSERATSATAGERSLALWLLVGAILVGAAMWLAPGLPSVPLNRDVQNHAYFVARMAHENTVDTDVVLSQSPTDPASVASYYPLASHVTVATARRATGQPIAELLIAWAAMSAILVLPCGLYSLGRRLAPDRPLIAGFAALAGSGLAVFPYQPFVWGGVAFLVTMTLVPGVLALALESVDRRDTALIGLTAASVLGVALAHTSEVVLLAILLAGFAAWDLWGSGTADRDPRERRRTAAVWGSLAAMCAVLLLPELLAMLAGSSERAPIAETLDVGVIETIRRGVSFDVDEGPPQPLIGGLALIGAAILLAGRRNRPLRRFAPLMATLGLLALLVVATSMSGAPWDAMRVLTVPWYRSYWRLTYNVALFAPLFVGVAGAAACDLAVRRSGRPVGIHGAVLAVSLVVISTPVVWTTMQGTGVRDRAFSAEELALFHDLRAEVAEGDGDGSRGRTSAVLNQENDASAWAYAIAGVPTFSGLKGYTAGSAPEDRSYLLRRIADASTDGRVRQLLRRWNIDLVLVADGTYSRERATITSDELRDADGFRVIDHRGRYWVFAVPSLDDAGEHEVSAGAG